MDVEVGLTKIEDSNCFLRALWAELRKNFDCKGGWLFMPFKEGNKRKISFGNMNIGKTALAISISYKERGSIQKIFFEHSNNSPIDKNSKLGQILVKSVNSALEIRDEPKNIFFESTIKSIYPVLLFRYVGKQFIIESNARNQFTLGVQVKAYDEIDAKAEFMKKVQYVIDIISIETNIPFWFNLKFKRKKRSIKNLSLDEIFVDDVDWIDDLPIRDGYLVLSIEGKKLLDLVTKDEITKDISLFLKACKHFHTARKYDAQINDQLTGIETITIENMRNNPLISAYLMSSAQLEIATVLYISSLELASVIGEENNQVCEKCGQKIYKIRKRVLDMTNKFLNSNQLFDDFYQKRSEYLHAGIFLTDETYTGITIPQIDTSNWSKFHSGCKEYQKVPLVNIREYTSYCLRNVLKTFFKP